MFERSSWCFRMDCLEDFGLVSVRDRDVVEGTMGERYVTPIRLVGGGREEGCLTGGLSAVGISVVAKD